jgi:membrane fusion protein, heavy metal efflux system
MKFRLPLTLFTVLALGGVGAFFIVRSAHGQPAGDAMEGGHGAPAKPEIVKGPHHGRLLTDGDFALELAIFEDDVPPEFRAWFTRGGKPVAPADVKLTVKLTRPGNVVDQHVFAPVGDFARSNQEVYEPHSFTYEIVAEEAGRSHRWKIDAPEMQTTITAAGTQQAGVQVAAAGPVPMADILVVYGQVKLNSDRIARAGARFGGVVRETRKSLGDAVQAGEIVAIVETNQTLATLEVKAPLTGVVVDRNATAGEMVAEGGALYVIADLATVWIDLNIPKSAQGRMRVGQPVVIHPDDGGAEATGSIGWISPFSSGEAQTLIARVVLANPDARWRPGLFVKAGIKLDQVDVPVAVKESGLQTLFDFTVVFSRHGELYQARPLELGRRSGGYVEVLKGLRPGELYVTDNSFLIKADIGKSGASHDH